MTPLQVIRLLAATESARGMISLRNVSGQDMLAQFGTKRRENLSSPLSEFLPE
ncbi:SecY-interacting protein Syd [Edaphovirga cremea]|uniref:SecY-interacting protein Syd n=1 Tax=Edaphovirga cremea TaxID=2267246 RepID=UPI000DEF75A2